MVCVLCSDEVSHVHGHLLHGCVVEGLDVTQGALVILSHHVDSHALPAETPASTNPAQEGEAVKTCVQRLANIDNRGRHKPKTLFDSPGIL